MRFLLGFAALVSLTPMSGLSQTSATEHQLTKAPHGHLLTNIGCWSHDGEWIVYDVRPDAAGSLFEGDRIERVHRESGKVEVLYQSQNEAYCGVVTASPIDDRVVFIHGPEHPTPDWQYAGNHRHGVIVSAKRPGQADKLDARNLMAPFTEGALRGGSHVHVFSGNAQWISFTYQDHTLAQIDPALDLRNVGISVASRPVTVPKTHPRNHDGTHFTVLVTRTTPNPKPGSDDIKRAFSDAWVGRQSQAIAFLGDLITESGETITELFIVDLPIDPTQAEEGQALAGTAATPPTPPRGVIQRRLTFTSTRKYPGIQGPRHWPRSAPDSSKIAFIMKDDDGIAQLWTIAPSGGKPHQVTNGPHPISSAFSWSPDGQSIATVINQAVCTIGVQDHVVTQRTPAHPSPPRPEACVFSPDGKHIAYVREVHGHNQIFFCTAW